MAVFSSLSSFFRRNKRKLIISTSLTITLYFLFDHFVIKKLKNFQNSLRQELIFKEQIKRRFLQTQQDCYYTILALLPVLSDPIIKHVPVELITQALKLKKSNQSNLEMSDSLLTTDNLSLHENNDNLELSKYINKSKNELWNALKIKTLTRSLTLIYALSGLLLITRLQLNILARRSYLELAIVMAGGKLPNDINEGENYLIEQSYLSLSWWLLNKGWLTVSDTIEEIVSKKFRKVNARTELSLDDFNQLLNEILDELCIEKREEVFQSLFPITYDNLVESLLNTNPDLIRELDVRDSNLLKLINETKYLIKTEIFNDILIKLLHNGKSTLINNVAVNLNPSLLLNNSDKIELIDDKPFKLASFLAQLSVQNNILVDNNCLDGTQHSELSGNVFVNNMNDLEELDEFSAGIYSNFE
ncbi:uncharacterized protein PRCAT00001591001 [Priceomyces carsonii]|uniref:uncharacterized protein n=1 Tax=Priceomyces carsonii TaxID=28549 RepID=UPI002ED90A66|nr:unnamed protein product [Priceomyces carsonii]